MPEPGNNRVPFLAVAWLIPVALLAIAVGVHGIVTAHSLVGRPEHVHFTGWPARTYSAIFVIMGLAVLRAARMSWRRGTIDIDDLLLLALLWLAGAVVAVTFAIAAIP